MTAREAQEHPASDRNKKAKSLSAPLPARPGSREGHDVLRLQRTIGNRATVALLEDGITRKPDHRDEDRLDRRTNGNALAVAGLAKSVVQRADVEGANTNFDELDAAFEEAAEKERELYDKRQLGTREVAANLSEEDAPSIGDIIVKAAIMGALSYATGGLSMALTNRLVSVGASNVIENAVQSGIDDAMKEVIPGVVDMVFSEGSTSKSSYFAGIEEGIIHLRTVAVLKLSAQKQNAKTAARSDPSSLPGAIESITARTKIVDILKDTARGEQYRESLGQWMVAMAQGAIGSGIDSSGTAMEKMPGHGGDPARFFHQGTTPGVLRLSFGLKPAVRPLTINAGVITGLNDVTKNKLKETKIRDLGIPVFAQGWIYDGFFDALEKADNEVTMSMNEVGTVFVNYGPDAEDAMKSGAFSRGETDVVSIVSDVLKNDIGSQTFGSVDLLGK